MSKELGEPDGAAPLDMDEIEGLRFTHITTRGELDQLEQANIVEGLQWLKKQKNADILSEGFVRDLHKRLFGQVWKGRVRSVKQKRTSVLIHFRSQFNCDNYWTIRATG